MARFSFRTAVCLATLCATPFMGGCVAAWPLMAAQLLLSQNDAATQPTTPESIGRLYAPISLPSATRAS